MCWLNTCLSTQNYTLAAMLAEGLVTQQLQDPVATALSHSSRFWVFDMQSPQRLQFRGRALP